jgi:hypothetical protein
MLFFVAALPIGWRRRGILVPELISRRQLCTLGEGRTIAVRRLGCRLEGWSKMEQFWSNECAKLSIIKHYAHAARCSEFNTLSGKCEEKQ